MLALTACNPRIPETELPSEPIAFSKQAVGDGILSREQFRDALRADNPDDPKAKRPKFRTEVSLLSLATGEVKTVPDSGADAFALDWSPDGTRLLIGRYDSVERSFRLVAWNALTGAWTTAVREPAGNGASIANGPIRVAWQGAILQKGGVPGAAIFVETDGSGQGVLPAGIGGQEPDIAPDGKSVLFSVPDVRDPSRPLIFVAGLGERTGKPLTRGQHPRFSRDGKWVTFTRTALRSSDVWIMRADGSGKRQITRTSYIEDFPAASPDGRFVVFASERGGEGSSQLYVVRVADGAEQQVTHNGQCSRPVW